MSSHAFNDGFASRIRGEDRDEGPFDPTTRSNARNNNVPSRFELFYKQPGEKWITIEPETRVPNAAVFRIAKEDHTLANLLRARLLQNPAVVFAAYKVPHPLFAVFELRVQTNGSVAPKEAVLQACRECVQDLQHLSQVFTREWELSKVMGEGRGGAGDLGM